MAFLYALAVSNFPRKEQKMKVKKLVFSALMLALATVLSLLKIDMPLGGGLTIVSMLPIVIVAMRYNLGWGLAVSFLHGGIQLLLGLDNVAYAKTLPVALAIIFLDYIIAYGVLGFTGIFKKRFKSIISATVVGMALTFTLRFLCHFITGWVVWDALWPNEFGMVSPIYSLAYNGIYMIPEFILTFGVFILLYKVNFFKRFPLN